MSAGHSIVTREYEHWNSFVVRCSCGWAEKAMDESIAMGRWRIHAREARRPSDVK